MSKEKIKSRWLFFGKDKYTYDTIDELVNKSMGLAVGEVVTLNGYYSADDGATHKRVIADTDDGSGVQLRSGKWANIVHNGEVNVSWFGAKGDGVTDDTQAIQKSVNIGKVINLENKTYIITKKISLKSNIKILGNNSILKIKNNTLIDTILDINQGENILINNLIFDTNMQNNVIYDGSTTEKYSKIYNLAINSYNATGYLHITNCKFINLYNEFIRIYGGTCEYLIENNTFKSPVQQQGYRVDEVTINSVYNNNSKIIIRDNIFNNEPYEDPAKGVCGITIAGVYCDTLIDNNYMNYVGRDNTYHHRLLAIDCYFDVKNVTISNNKIYNAKWGFVRFDNAINCIVKDNYFQRNTTSSKKNTESFFWCTAQNKVEKSLKNIDICGNTFDIDGIGLSIYPSSSQDYIIDNIKIRNNNFYGSYANHTIGIGYGVNNVYISNNCITSKVSSSDIAIIQANNNIISSLSTENIVISNNNTYSPSNFIVLKKADEYNQKISNIRIENNIVKHSGKTQGNEGITLAKKCEFVKIKNNVITSKLIGVGLHNLAKDNPTVFIEDNIFKNLQHPSYGIGNPNNVSITNINNMIFTGENNIVPAQVSQINTLYYGEKMQQEGVYDDFIMYMDDKVAYDKEQQRLEKERQAKYQKDLEVNSELTYEEWLSQQPALLPYMEEPRLTSALQKFMDKYL